MNPPSTYAELTATFGNIVDYIHHDGTLSPSWESNKIRRVSLPSSVAYAYDPKIRITQITCHVLIYEIVQNMYKAMYDAGLWEALGPYGGGFSYRPNRNDPTKISLHAWGLAWDWDVANFPNGSPKKRDPTLIKVAAKYGVRCGQDFHGTKDPQHFSYSSGEIG